jgi:O-antigen ligase
MWLQNGVSNHDPVGIMGIKAVSGVFAAICLPIAMFFSPWLSVLIIPPLALSQCSSGVLAAVVSILFIAWYNSRRTFGLLLVPIVLAGGLFVANDAKMNMMTDRAKLWKLAATDALQHPVVGMGLDSFRNLSNMKPFLYFKDATNNNALRMNYNRMTGGWNKPAGYDLQYQVRTDNQGKVVFKQDGTPEMEAMVNPWDNPHNEFISILYEFGLVGLLLFGALLWDITRRLYRDPIVITLYAVFLAYLVSSIGQFPFHLARTGYLAAIFLACYYKLTSKGAVNG